MTAETLVTFVEPRRMTRTPEGDPVFQTAAYCCDQCSRNSEVTSSNRCLIQLRSASLCKDVGNSMQLHTCAYCADEYSSRVTTNAVITDSSETCNIVMGLGKRPACGACSARTGSSAGSRMAAALVAAGLWTLYLASMHQSIAGVTIPGPRAH